MYIYIYTHTHIFFVYIGPQCLQCCHNINVFLIRMYGIRPDLYCRFPADCEASGCVAFGLSSWTVSRRNRSPP